jgi:hypothetical protein
MAISTGYDFSEVRVKTDSEAATLNQSTHARAFTLGRDIWLGKNESPNDLRLMAHELTHVVQQGAARPLSSVSTSGPDVKKKKNSAMDYLQGLAGDKVHDPKVFTKAIDRFAASNPSDHIAGLQRQVLERKDSTRINQKSDSMVMRACGCSGGSGPSPAPCAIPTNFRETARAKQAGGVLYFQYAWDSSTGTLGDLSACEVGEHVSYAKVESPPWKNVNNPTVQWVPATPGKFPNGDHHSPGVIKPYKESTLDATQYYRFHCPCHDSDKPTNLMGPIAINRKIEKRADGKFKYSITKSGLSNEIDPLP